MGERVRISRESVQNFPSRESLRLVDSNSSDRYTRSSRLRYMRDSQASRIRTERFTISAASSRHIRDSPRSAQLRTREGTHESRIA